MKSNLIIYWRQTTSALILLTLLSVQTYAQAAAPAKASSLSPTENELVEKINIPTIKEITAALSAPEMEGRGTMPPGDMIQPNWAWEGAETVAEVMGILGWRISETEKMPEWLPTSRFAKLERGNTKEIPEEK